MYCIYVSPLKAEERGPEEWEVREWSGKYAVFSSYGVETHCCYITSHKLVSEAQAKGDTLAKRRGIIALKLFKALKICSSKS
jgi:hypothetical protein